MCTKSNPGKFDCYAKAEPEGDWPMIGEARMCAQAMRNWRFANRPTIGAEHPMGLTREPWDARLFETVLIVADQARRSTDEEIRETMEAHLAGFVNSPPFAKAVAIVTACCGPRPE